MTSTKINSDDREECPKCHQNTAHGSGDSWACDAGYDLTGYGKCPGVSGSECQGWYQGDAGYCESCFKEM